MAESRRDRIVRGAKCDSAVRSRHAPGTSREMMNDGKEGAPTRRLSPAAVRATRRRCCAMVSAEAGSRLTRCHRSVVTAMIGWRVWSAQASLLHGP